MDIVRIGDGVVRNGGWICRRWLVVLVAVRFLWRLVGREALIQAVDEVLMVRCR